MQQDTIKTSDYYAALDKADPLKSARDMFEIPDGLIYFDGNSLGPMLKAIPARVDDFVRREWGQDLIQSWNKNDWWDSPYRVGGKIAKLIGANEHEVVATDSVSVNLYKVLIAALRLRPDRTKIITENSNFPTNLYVLSGAVETMASNHQIVAHDDRADILDSIDDDTALVTLTDVHYKTGHRLDMAAIAKKAHQHGALVLWDLCHSAGILDVDLNGTGADFAVGCTYKYLNGGPGSPAFIFIADRHQNKIRQPISGWWGHKAPFQFTDDYAPKQGIGRALSGTQSMLAMTCLETAIDAISAFDMKDIAAKSGKLGDEFISLVEQFCGDCDFRLISPRNANERGGQVAFSHAEAYPIMQAMIHNDVIGDFRAPDVLRVGFSPLFLRYQDIWDAATILKQIMETDEWRQSRFTERLAVT